MRKRFVLTALGSVVAWCLPVWAATPVFVQTQRADVTGDGRADLVQLIGGSAEKGGRYMDKMALRVTPGDARQSPFGVELPDRLGGYEPKLQLADLDGDGHPDAFIQAATGGSGGFYTFWAATLTHGKVCPFLDAEGTRLPAITGQLIDGYKASVEIPGQPPQTLDLASRKAYYDQQGVYKDGRLLKPVVLWGGERPTLVTPVDPDRDGYYDLSASWDLRGLANVDRVARISGVLRFADGLWLLHSARLEPLGDK